jgi:hypothetical protein
MTDLESISPLGRFDVLVYRGAEYLTKQIEAQYGLSGIWDNLKPHVNQAVVGGLGGWELPTEAKVLLSIFQANMQRKQIE